MIPGPLSRTVTRNRVALAMEGATPSAGGSSSTGCPAFDPPLSASILIQTSGRIWASSHASSELSTASLTVVSSALRGLSNPNKWRFLAKNSLTAISFCFEARVSAVSPLGLGGRVAGFSVGGLPRVGLAMGIVLRDVLYSLYSLQSECTLQPNFLQH